MVWVEADDPEMGTKDRCPEKGQKKGERGGKVQRTATEWRKKNKTNSTLAIGSNTHS